MRQLAGQLKKDKDGAIKKISGLEKEIADAMNKIQVYVVFISYTYIFLIIARDR